MILGIESTAHTFGVGIVTSDCEVLANEKEQLTSTVGGLIPNEIVDHHNRVKHNVLTRALRKANVTMEQVEAISYSAGPGIDPVLWVGYHFASELAQRYSKQLIPVNHAAAHLSIGEALANAKNPVYLYVSGVNTQVIVYKDGYRVLGETFDIGLGNMLDKFGREAELGFPAGPKIEQIAKQGQYIELPYTVKGMDVSFSGLYSKSLQLLQKGESIENLSYSLQETAFAMLAEVAERAMAHFESNELILVGGVGANKRFCGMLDVMCQERGATFYAVPISLAGDQGAMIAWEGYKRRSKECSVVVDARWRLERY